MDMKKYCVFGISLMMIIMTSGGLLWSCAEENLPDVEEEIIEEEEEEVETEEENNDDVDLGKYQAFFGTTHGHSSYSGDAQQSGNTPAINFQEAKRNGFQFYILTDHTQYENFSDEAWNDIKAQAENHIEDDFVSIHGFEYSENNGPGGRGHINAINTTDYLNALADGMWLDYFYGWLVEQNKQTRVVATFNHPGLDQYNDWDYFSHERRDIITMLEVINGVTKSETKSDSIIGKNHYPSWLKALQKGWRVSPVAGLDAHSPNALHKGEYRTGIWAESLTREKLLDAMANRRTFATHDRNLSVFYWVNGQEMGTVLTNPTKLNFRIVASDPDIEKSIDRIRRIEIIAGNDVVVEAKNFDSHEVDWETSLNTEFDYYLLKIYSYKDNSQPIAYVAPVWIEK